MADILRTFQQAYAIPGAAAEANQQARDQRAVRNLAPAAIGGDPQAQAQVAAISPGAAQAYAAQSNELLGRTRLAAQHLQQAIQSGDPAAIQAARQQIKPFMDTIKPGTSYPLDRDPAEELPMIESFLASTAATGGADGRDNKVVGGALVTPRGEVVYEAPVNTTLVDIPDGSGGSVKMIYNPRTQQLAPLPQGGAGGALQGMQAADGSPYRIEPGNEDLAAVAAADMAGGQTGADVRLPERAGQPGGFGYTPAKPEISAAESIRLQLAQEAAQRAAEAGQRADRAEARADRQEQRSLQANAISGRPPTEDERKAAGWLNQAEFARQQMLEALQTDPDAATAGVVEAYAPSEELRNRSMSPARQRYAQAASSFAEAALRAATGAGINIFEAQQKIRELTPQRGDSREVIAQKGRAQEQYIESLRARAGRAIPQQQAAPASAPALPPGFSWEN